MTGRPERPTVPVPAERQPDGRGAYERALELARQDPFLGAVVPFGHWFRAAVRGMRPEQIRALAVRPEHMRYFEFMVALGGPETEQSN